MEKITLKHLADAGQGFYTGVISEELFKDLIFRYVSDEENIIPNMLNILYKERETKKELLRDTNAELSRSLSGLMHFDKQTKSHKEMRTFMIDEIKKHYIKWRNYILCTLKIEGLD